MAAPIRESLTAHTALLNELVSSGLQPMLRKQGITSTIFELLSAVRVAGGRATQVEIARRLGISAPSLSEAAGNAISKGLLERVPLETDARAKLLRLTPEGSKVLQRTLRFHAEIETIGLEGIEPDKLVTAIDVLRRVSRNIARTLEHEE